MTDETVFAVALEKPAAERAAYLDSACAGDPEQRKRVEGLLAALEAAGGFLEKPAVARPGPDLGPTRDFHTPEAPADAPTRAEGEGDDDTDDALGFLAPAGRPDSLGRIGHYEVLEVLGRGGFGIVFRAFDDVLQRVVAVKVLAPSIAATSPARKRFLREARSAAPIQHENVVRIHNTGEEPLPYLVMEFVPGETLQARLDRTGPLEAPEAIKIARQVAAGLAAAHDKGLIHRDIKPSNILIDSGPQQQVKITDFGLARAADDASLTRSGVVAGTPMYMAPEQAKGEALDHRADLFSLGSVLYAMLTGRPPFRAESTLAVLKRVAEDTPRPIREVIPEVPDWLCRIVEKLHAKDPAGRFQSAREVADLLADCEKQLAAHQELKDTSRIPEVKPVPQEYEYRMTVSKIVLWFLMIFVLPFAVVVPWMMYVVFGGLYQENKGALILGPQEELGAVMVLKNDRGVVEPNDPGTVPVTDWLGMKWEHTQTLPPGTYQINARPRAGTQVEHWEVTTNGAFSRSKVVVPGPSAIVTVVRGKRVTVRAVLRTESPAPASQPQPADGFVQLFNGRDLSGWNPHPKWPGRWQVEGGTLFCRGLAYLLSEREYANFHLRARMKASGGTGIYFRAAAPAGNYPTGWVADTTFFALARATPGWERKPSLQPVAVPANEWFDLEIIAVGERITITVNRVAVVIHSADPAAPKSGLLALHAHENSEFYFRKVEIKELPPSPPPAGFVPLFNGKNLSGWTRGRNSPGDWRVEDGALVGRRGPGYLFSAKAYDNFHLRVEAKVNAAGNSGVSFGRRHQVEIRHDPLCPTGSLLEFEPGKTPSITRYPHPQPAPDQWFELELKVEGESVAVRIDGGPWNTLRVERAGGPSPLELEALDAETVVQFRKIEIKELPPQTPEERAKEDAARLNGEWVVRTGKVDGLPLAAEDNEEMKLFLQNGKFTLPIRDDSGYPWALTGIYTIDAAKKQLAFKFNHEPQDTPPVLCSYRFEGDTLVLDFPEPKADGHQVLGTLPFARDRRVTSQRNLKDIGIAMHNYTVTHDDALPPAAITNPKDKDGKPLLSWRVALLPYLGEEKLYKQFKLDEPWDSEHNKKLIAQMPKVFKTPGVKAEPGITHYRVFVGPGTAFEPRPAGAKGLRFIDFEDGTSGTILVVEAATEPVVWTKPDDLPYDPKKPLPKLVGADSLGAHVLMADGSVWQILPEAWPAGIRDAIVRNNAVGPWNKAAWNRLFRGIPPRGPAVRLEFQRRSTAPPSAVAPFDAAKAKGLQEAWAKHLGVPVELTNSIGMKLRLIPPGEFQMGSTAGEIEKLLADEKETAKFLVNAEGPRRSVRISAPFYMGAFEVTQAEYLRVMGANPSHFSASGKAADKVEGLDTEKLGFPVENVSWDDAVEFCKKLSELPEERAAGRVYRLATEAQWEYACRAGTAGRFHTGDALGVADANFDRSLGRPARVGSFPANAFGLHDMHGNVFEWCADWFAPDYRDLPSLDPEGPAAGEARVVRGGNYAYRDRYCRSAARDRFQPAAKRGGIGFRVVIVGDIKPPAPKKRPDPAVVRPLKDAAAARERTVADAKTRFEVGKASRLDVLAAEVDLTEARVKLAEAEGDAAAVAARLEELVKHRVEERELVKARVDAGIDRAELLDQADFRLAQAKARLAKVKPPGPEVAPAPRPAPKK